MPGKDHLKVKLADLGLAEHSIDRKRDCDLFAYTVLCRDFFFCKTTSDTIENQLKSSKTT